MSNFTLLVCVILALSMANLFQYKKYRKEKMRIRTIVDNYEEQRNRLMRGCLLDLAPEKVRFLTRDEARGYWEDTGSLFQEDPGPSEGLYIINPSEDDLRKIATFCELFGTSITWRLKKAPYYVIPGEMTEEDMRRYYYKRFTSNLQTQP